MTRRRLLCCSYGLFGLAEALMGLICLLSAGMEALEFGAGIPLVAAGIGNPRRLRCLLLQPLTLARLHLRSRSAALLLAGAIGLGGHRLGLSLDKPEKKNFLLFIGYFFVVNFYFYNYLLQLFIYCKFLKFDYFVWISLNMNY